ncbi:MAG: EamA family transporter [Steroidobacterales bacterium]
MNWLGFALISAFAAGATAILAKLGIEGVSSNLAMAIRTTVVLVFAWGLVLARGENAGLPELPGRTWIFLALSGIATGVSWIAYFKALSLAPAARVAPIDKLSLAFTLLMAWLVLGEPVSWRIALGGLMMIAGALLTLPA